MASLQAMRDAIKTTIDANVDGLIVYDTVPDLPVLPCLIVLPVECNFDGSMGRGFDDWAFDLFVMTSRTVPRVGQDGLDSFIAGAGDQSVRQVVFNNRTLGLSGTDAHISGMSRYGGSFAAVNTEHVGAVLRLVVSTPGTA